MQITSIYATDIGNDVLRVTATVDTGRTIKVTDAEGGAAEAAELATVVVDGWVSALAACYPPEAYNADGSLRELLNETTTPATWEPVVPRRPKTDAEKAAYCAALVAEAYAALAGPPEGGPTVTFHT